MTQFKRQLIAILATGSVALSALAPAAFADSTLVISGNGSSSNNNVKLEQSTNTTVVQSNVANVTNTVNTSSSTGGNKANDNTGGDVTVKTGDATTQTTIKNTLNSNTAQVNCCNTGDVTASILGNGSSSKNDVKLDQKTGAATSVFQDNTANVVNSVDSSAKTGANEANNTTGGDVLIKTGDALAISDVKTTANVNQAVVGGGVGSNSPAGTLTAIIDGNGTNSHNDLHLDLSKSTSIVQDNLANVVNDVNSDATTGKNKANDSTNGAVTIETGAATAASMIDNNVNFNAAEIDCGCLLDTKAKIEGNGSNSKSDIHAQLGGDQSVFQGGQEGTGNLADLVNTAGADAKTGKNDALFNTGSVVLGSDPYINTGDATNVTTVANSGNSNVYGSMLDLPAFDFSFNFGSIFGI